MAFNVIGFTAVSLLGYILNGFALTVMWGWFIVPVFELPALAIVPAIGLALVAGFLTHQPMEQRTDQLISDTLLDSLVFSVLRPLEFLFIGWIVSLFL
jgi:hypothetical protein